LGPLNSVTPAEPPDTHISATSGQTVEVSETGDVKNANGSAATSTRTRRFQIRHLVIAVLLCVVVGSGYVLFQKSHTNGISLDGGIVERLIPAPGLKVLKQDAIGADLAPGYEAKLALDGVPIPDYQLTSIPELGQYMLNPVVGSDFEALPTGDHCAEVTYWRTMDGPTQSTTRSWCFTVL
jgi:hypothetical protein